MHRICFLQVHRSQLLPQKYLQKFLSYHDFVNFKPDLLYLPSYEHASLYNHGSILPEFNCEQCILFLMQEVERGGAICLLVILCDSYT